MEKTMEKSFTTKHTKHTKKNQHGSLRVLRVLRVKLNLILGFNE